MHKLHTRCRTLISKIIFSEKSLSVHMSVCPFVRLSRPVPSLSPSPSPPKVTYSDSEFQKPSQTAAKRGEAELRIFNFKTTL